MRALIAGLMEYARIDKREALEEIDCNELLKIVLVDLDDRIKRNAAVITVETLPVLKAYPTYLRLLFQNLISNAIKFKKANGTPEIVISGIERDKDWEFTVSDNGIGIAKKNIEQIFTIFKRLNNQEEYEGYGIGLAHCKKIVSLHGGDIWVDSVLGEGSCFNFTIKKII
jgi:light-regulated signal transduction histidine kinase (bacteriophytochrome)